MTQTSLELAEETLPNSGIAYKAIPAKNATFKSGLAARVHRWFRLTPSFGPDLVQEMLSRLECSRTDVVLDPFAGAATTLIESQLEERRAIGFELNPFLHFVGKTSLNWTLQPQSLGEALSELLADYIERESYSEGKNYNEIEFSIPPIHNPTRWWRPDILKRLILLKQSIRNVEDPEMRDFFSLALAGVLVPDLTNVTLGRLQLHFINRDKDPIDVLGVFTSHATSMIQDLESIQATGFKSTSRLLLADATKVCPAVVQNSISCVITSPPYPNRYSYVWNTRPHLYFFDYFSNARQASDLDKGTIGGTWGTATSILSKGAIDPIHPAVSEVVGPTVHEIRSVDNLMANYVMKYFNMLTEQLLAMNTLLTPDARIAYVIGCSRIKDVFVETDVMLAKILERLEIGFAAPLVERIRKRHSGKDLHESIVYAWKR